MHRDGVTESGRNAGHALVFEGSEALDFGIAGGHADGGERGDGVEAAGAARVERSRGGSSGGGKAAGAGEGRGVCGGLELAVDEESVAEVNDDARDADESDEHKGDHRQNLGGLTADEKPKSGKPKSGEAKRGGVREVTGPSRWWWR